MGTIGSSFYSFSSGPKNIKTVVILMLINGIRYQRQFIHIAKANSA